MTMIKGLKNEILLLGILFFYTTLGCKYFA